MSYLPGPISVREASFLDETNGRNWTMQQANDVRFLAVRGTIVIGEIPLYYQFTLVKYHMYIDTVPWTIFSTLEKALDKEFDSQFFALLNSKRRDRCGFLNVAWRPTAADYDVDTPYSTTRLSIFDTYGHTRKEVKPFQYNHDFLRVHVNGAAVYSDNADLAFLLPLIVDAHRLLPEVPIFWDDGHGSIALYRTSMWMHEDTITWLARTGKPYPEALHTLIEPRIRAVRARLYGQRQLPVAEQSNRKQERLPANSGQPTMQYQQPPPPQRVRPPTGSTPMCNLNINHDRHYMRLQEVFLDISHISAPAPAGEPTQEVPSYTSLPSEAHCSAAIVNTKEQLPTGAVAQCQEQESDDSSDWSITPDRLQQALERANLPALDLLQKSYEDQVAALEIKLTRAKARLHLISKRQRTLRASEPRDPLLDAVD